jgi:Tfp pilus assembly protein FimV
VEAAVIQWRPLGEMLVERGLLSQAELEDALEEQERTGQRLGALLVARKIVAGAVLTSILAEQVGVELETQRGFGSGLFAKMARKNGRADLPETTQAPRRPRPMPTTAEAPSAQPPAFVDELLLELDHVRGELEAERARRAKLQAELDALRAKPQPGARPQQARRRSTKRKPKPTGV